MKNRLFFLNNYLSKIKNTDSLTFKFKAELWAVNNLPVFICKFFGELSILGQKLKS